MANNKINFEVGFITDSKGLSKLKSELNEIRTMANNLDFTAGMDSSKIQAMVKSANDLEYAMNAAFDVDLNTVNVQKFNQILKQSNTDLSQIQQGLAAAGTVGQSAFLKATAGLMQFNTAAKQTNHFLDSIATSLANTIKWSIMSSIINKISGTIQQSYYYVKDLDSALNDIRIVTGKNADEMERFAESANNAAKALAVTTEDYTQGSLIYYQQGLDDETVKTLTDITAKTSNVTGQSMSAVSEELTAVWNGYKVANEAAKEGMQVYEEYVDKMAAVGASTASDLQELSTAMSKVASAASAMGVDFDDLNAQIATIVSVTRQAPESVGTALKTIYARLGDLKVDGVDEFGVKLGEVTGQLQTMGIQILDSNGDMRDMTTVMTEVAEKWDTWTSAQRQAAAVAMAGKRQYNNLIALFDNWDMYGEALETSMNAAGTLEEQQEIALDSLANKMDQLKATAEDLYDSLYDENDIKSLVEGLTGAVQILADFSDSIGGLINLIPMLGSTAMRVFSNQIANGLSTIIINAQNARRETQMMAENANQLRMMFSDSSLFSNTGEEDISPAMQQGVEQLKKYYRDMQQYQSIMSQEQKETYNNILNNIAKVGEYNIEIEKINNKLADEKNSWKLIGNEILENNEDVSKIYKEVGKINTVVEKLENQLNDIGTENLNLDKFKDLLKGLDPSQIDILSKKFEKLSKDGNITEENFQKIINKLKEVGNNTEEVAKLTQQMKNLRDGTKEAGESLRNNLSLQQHISNITNAIGALGQLATSINTIKNLGSIWSNEDISGGEKFLQTIMNLSFALPALINSTQKLNSVIMQSNSLFANRASLIEVTNARQQISNVLTQNGLNYSLKELSLMSKQEIKKKIFYKLVEKEALARGVTTEEIVNEMGAEIAETAAKEAETIATQQATAAQNAFTAALLSNPITAIILAITAAVTAYQVYTAAIEKHIQAQEKEAEKAHERVELLKQEAEAHEQAYESFKEVQDKYSEGNASKQELRDISLDLIEAYGLEGEALDVLAGRYDKVAEAAANAREQERLELLQAQEKEFEEDTKSVYAEGEHPFDMLSKTSNGMSANISSVMGPNPESRETNSPEKKYVEEYNKIAKEIFGQEIDIQNIEIKNTKDLIDFYNNLIKLKERVSKINIQGIDHDTAEEEAKSLQEILNALNVDNKIDKIIEDQKNRLDLLMKAPLSAETQEEFDKKIEQFSKTLEEEQKAGRISSEKSIDDLLIDYTSKIDNKFAQDYTIKESLKKNFGEGISEGVQEAFSKLDEEAQNHLLEIGFDFNSENADQLLQEYQKYYENDSDKVVAIPVTFQRQLLDDIGKGKDIKKEDWESLQSITPLAKDILGEDRTEFNNKSVGERLQLMKELNATILEYNKLNADTASKQKEAGDEIKKILQERIDLLNKELTKLQDDLTNAPEQYKTEIQKSIDEIIEKIVELEDEKISIGIEIADDSLDNAFEGLRSMIGETVTTADQLVSATEAIGEGWKVAAEDVAQFAAAFPELMDDAVLLEEGSIRLDEKLTNSALQSAQKRMDANSEVTIAAIDDKLTQLEAEKKFQEEKIKILKDLLEGEIDEQTAIQNLNAATTDYKRELANNELIDQATATEASIEISKQGAEGILDTFEQINNAIIIMHGNYSNMFTNGPMLDIKTGVEVSTNISAGSINSTTPDASALSEEVRRAAEQELAAAEARKSEIDKEIASLWGAKSEIQSRRHQADANIDRVSKGLAGKEDKSSSKDKTKSQKEKKREEDEIDRYWEINKALDKIADALKKVDKLKSHVFGKQKIQLLQQEASLIKQQTQLYEKLYEEQKKEAEELRAKLSAEGAAFSTEGEVLNYGEALRGALAIYNKAVDDFNAGLIDDQAFKIAEDNYQKFKKDMDRYDKLFYTEMKNTREKIEEEAQKLRDIEIEKFEIKLQIKIDKAQLRKDFRNFRKELQKDFTLTYEVLPKTKDFRKDFKDDKSQVKSYMNAAKEIEKEIDIIMAGGTSKMFASLSEAQEKLKEVNEKFQEASKNTMQDVEDAWDNYIELIDQTNEKLDDQIERYNQIQDELDDWKQMIELVYGEKAYKEMDTYYKQAEENSLAQIASLKKISDAWAAQFQKAFEAEGASMERTDQWSEDLTRLYQNWINSENNLRDATNEHIKLLKDDYANAVEGIIDQLDKDLTGGKGLEQMKKEWEETKEYADKYYNTVQKAYQIQTLNNKIQKSINQQNSVKNAQKLEKLRQKELGELREMTNMSEYDLKIAEAKYDIALKEIALEEARNNKNSMKLTRNAEGNWSYQYVASEDEVADKEQDLLDAYMKLQDLSDEQMSKLMDEGLDAIENLKEEIRTVYKKAEAEYWSEKQLDDALAALRDKYYGEGGVITNIAKEFEKAREEAAESGLAVQATCYRLDQANFENLTNEIKRLFDDANDHLAKGYSEEEDGFEKTFERANSEMAKQWNDFLENNSTGIKPKWLEASKLMGQAWVGKEDSVKADVSTAFDGIKTKFNGYLNGLTELQKKSGITFKNISNYIKETAKETKEVNKNIKELVKQTKNIDKQRQAVEKLMSAWDKVKSSIDGASKSIEEYLKKQQDLKTPSTPETVGSSGSGSDSGYSGSGSGSGNDKPKITETPKTLGKDGYPYRIVYVSEPYYRGSTDTFAFTAKSSSGKMVTIDLGKNPNPNYDSRYKRYLEYPGVNWNTGGYTGSWNNGDTDGRLAFLHQKELILNKNDTSNFLAATDSLRNLVSLDSSIEKSIANAISKMLIHMTGANLNNTTIPSNNETNSNNIFNINAEFPNANDVTEIREAILSLPNLASQYIHRSGF